MPLIDCIVVLNPWIRTSPCSITNCIPNFFGRHAVHHFAVRTCNEIPAFAFFQLVEETMWDTYRVVTVLSAHRIIGFAFVIVRISSSNQCSHLALFCTLPFDELHGIWVIQIQADHLSGTTCSSATLDSTRRTVANLQETHQTRTCSATTQLLTRSANLAKVGSYTRTIFENTRFTNPQIHDTTLVYQIIVNRQNETSMRLRTLVSRGTLHQLLCIRIYKIVTLWFARNCITVV